MKKMLLAAALSLPMVAPAFADFRHSPATFTGAEAQVGSVQGSRATAGTYGSGAVVSGAVSGNYTDVTAHAGASGKPGGSAVNASATQFNIGGTVAGSAGFGHSVGSASGWQSSQSLGGATALVGNHSISAGQ